MPLRWEDHPDLDQPVLIAAFEGWNDAGDAASTALRYFQRQWGAQPFVDIDPEHFYDFTVNRPLVRIGEGDVRETDWPEDVFSWARTPSGLDVILLDGVEPNVLWRTFCAQIVEVATVCRVRLSLTLGALLAEVAHTRPVSVFGTAYDPTVIEALGLEPSRYEGPTGIVGVLHAALAAADMHSASLWAAVPSYVSGAPSPKAALALVEHASRLLNISVPMTELEIAAATYERQVSELVDDDDSTAAYVRQLEEEHDQTELAGETADDLVDEVERFLREQ